VRLDLFLKRLVRLTAWIREPPVWNQRLGDGGPDFRQLEPDRRLAHADRLAPTGRISKRRRRCCVLLMLRRGRGPESVLPTATVTATPSASEWPSYQAGNHSGPTACSIPCCTGLSAKVMSRRSGSRPRTAAGVNTIGSLEKARRSSQHGHRAQPERLWLSRRSALLNIPDAPVPYRTLPYSSTALTSGQRSEPHPRADRSRSQTCGAVLAALAGDATGRDT
jgi:hypothetical protein